MSKNSGQQQETGYAAPKVKGKVKIEKEQFNEVFKFDKKGDSITGKIIEVRETETKFGICNYIDIMDIETGEVVSFVESSNLAGYKFGERVGQWFTITFIDYERNPKTKNMYKVFEVEQLEVEE